MWIQIREAIPKAKKGDTKVSTIVNNTIKTSKSSKLTCMNQSLLKLANLDDSTNNSLMNILKENWKNCSLQFCYNK